MNLDAELTICSRCIYDERVPGIYFDTKGVCNYCHQVDDLVDHYGTGNAKGVKRFGEIVKAIKEEGKGRKYDCIVGVSGGTDSSYLLKVAMDWGLRPLAVHYDNTWNTATATINIHNVLKSLDLDLETLVVNNKEVDDILYAFFQAGVPELDAATDLGYAFLLRKMAAKYRIRAILEGHSFIAEGITPLGKNYFDGKYIHSIHRKFGKNGLSTYPLMTISKFLKSAILDRPKFIRPLWYLSYSKEEARKYLSKNFEWSYYGGHHLENRITAFAHSVYLPEKFGIDMRNNSLSARVRAGGLSRTDAWNEYNSKCNTEYDLVDYFKKRLGISEQAYKQKMLEQPKSWQEYPTYKQRFELLRPVFRILADLELVPMSFYLKYCFPMKQNR